MPKLFTGPQLPGLMAEVREACGADALILQTRRVLLPGGGRGYEVTAAGPEEETPSPAARIRDRALTGFSPAIARGSAPYRMALIGPTGAGKTTTIAKLAAHPGVFRGRKVGLLCLDTYRVGAVEQIRTWAEIARLPLEVVYERADLDAALKRLSGVEVLLVDCPGRGPRQHADTDAVTAWLERIAPNEIHLVLPAGLQPAVARRLLVEGRRRGATHVLASKLDECPEDATAFALAARIGLPMRWMTDGQDVPTDLRPAETRLLATAEDQGALDAVLGAA